LVKLGSGHHPDQLCLTQQPANRCKIKLAESTEPLNTLIEGTIRNGA
jgi:hypothetical protein